MSLFQPAEFTQALFRVLLRAMSYPGRCHAIAVDHPDTFALVGNHPVELAQSIQHRTGAAQQGPDRADFVFVGGDCSQGQVAEAKRGTLVYPDLGATLIYHLPSAAAADLETNRMNSIVFTGPGIKQDISPPDNSLNNAEYALLRDINADYPLGVDTFIIWGNAHIMAIPRSTRIEVN